MLIFLNAVLFQFYQGFNKESFYPLFFNVHNLRRFPLNRQNATLLWNKTVNPCRTGIVANAVCLSCCLCIKKTV